MSRITRRQVQAWLSPMRSCFRGIRQSGEAETIRGYAVTRLHHADEYARVDFCVAGFRGLLARVLPFLDVSPLLTIERKLANGVPLTVAELDGAFGLLRRCESLLVGMPKETIINAVQVEQIAIELESLGIKEAA